MADSKTAEFRFGLNGLLAKEDPTLLGNGQYRSMSNMEVQQEGSLASRSGRKRLGVGPINGSSAYKIQKLRVQAGEDPSLPSTNPRYVGFQSTSQDLYRTLDYNSWVKVASDINTLQGSVTSRFQVADYNAGASGNPWAFVASELKMLKDSGIAPFVPGGGYSELPRWGLLPAAGIALATPAGAGNLDGGDAASPTGSQPYDWRFTYISKDTGNEGNPSQLMLSTATDPTGAPQALHNQSATVTVWGTDDPQVLRIRIYRRGGILFDTWRLVGVVANPGVDLGTGLPLSTTFTDNVSDVDLAFKTQIELDNDPPVVSTVPFPLHSAFTAPVTHGFALVTMIDTGMQGIRPGTLVHIVDNGAPEDVVVASVVSPTQFTAFFLFDHAGGVLVEADAITGQSCSLAVPYSSQNAVVVAGDPVNPHMAYMSKSDQPEAFPVTPADGTIKQIGVGSPANPIVNLFEFRGNLVFLNASSIFETVAIRGSLLAPQEMATRGCIAREACCKTETEIWFLGYDGIWSWDGGNLRKRSEAIDPLFHGMTFNGIPAVATDPDSLRQTLLENRRGQIVFTYWDSNGSRQMLLCEPMFNDRWRHYDEFTQWLIEAYTETDTGSMILARFSPFTGPIFQLDEATTIITGINGTSNYTSDDWQSTPLDGQAIPFDLRLPWMEFGQPHTRKVLEEVFLDYEVFDALSPASLTCEILADFSDTPVDTLTVPLPAGGRRMASLLPNLGGFPLQSYGREARAFSYHFSGQAFPCPVIFYRLIFRYQEIAQLTAGGTGDWDDLGTKHDKRLYQMCVVFDTEGTDRQIVLEGITGRDGNVLGITKTFNLSNPTIIGPGRAMKVFPLSESGDDSDAVIVKLVRVRPLALTSAGTAATNFFKILEVSFPDREEFPPDVVSVTPWEDGGYEYDKILNQVDVEVDTNGQPVNFRVQADGLSVGPVLTVATLENDRRRNLTVPAGLVGKKWRIYCDPGQSAIAAGIAKFQLFSHSFKFQRYDPGEVTHTQDWNDLGHPYDKRLYLLTLRWDNTSGAAVTMALDLLSGVSGGVFQQAVQTFLIPANSGRSEKTFPLSDGLFAKMVRVYPQGNTIPVGFKSWNYTFQAENLPADIVPFTEWTDGGYAYDKYLNQVCLDVDTGGVDVQYTVQADGVTVFTDSVTTTSSDRRRNRTVPSGLIGRKFRLLVNPNQTAIASGGGKWQLYDVAFKWQQADKGEVIHTKDWDDLGYLWDKMLYTVTVEWNNATGAPVTLQLDTISGINGQVLTANVAQFVLANGRSQKVFPLPPDTVAKMIRLYPVGAVDPTFREWRYAFEKEDYPPDVVAYTPWFDGGYEYAKYLNQIDLEVDTNSQPITVQVQADGATVFAFAVTSSRSDRRRNITIPSDLQGKKWRLLIDPNQTAIASGAGKFQLWDRGGSLFRFQQADKGEVGHTFDWDDLGHAWDKYLVSFTVEWDCAGGGAVVLQLDTIGGIDGQDTNLSILTVTLSGGRGKREFPLPPDTIAKMIRLHPVDGSISGVFKQWKYHFDKIDYPQDIVHSSPWQDASTNDDKNPTWLWLDMDTQGVAATVELHNELGLVMTVQHTGTLTDRKRNYPIAPDVFAKMWRLIITEGVSGKAQLFNWSFSRWTPFDQGSSPDPPEKILWTPWNDFGWPYGKIARDMVLTVDTNGVTVPVELQTAEGGTVFTFNVTTTYTDRTAVVTCPSDLQGTLLRLVVPSIPTGARFKLWNWQLNFVKEPPAVTHFDSYETDFGVPWYKALKQMWLRYTSDSPVTVTITSDTGTYTATLPAHPNRTEERFYLPTVFPPGLNKSKVYRVQVDSATPFKFYPDGSVVEFLVFAEDRHSGYRQMKFSEFTAPEI